MAFVIFVKGTACFFLFHLFDTFAPFIVDSFKKFQLENFSIDFFHFLENIFMCKW